MIPTVPRWCIRLRPCVFYGYPSFSAPIRIQTTVYTLLDHSLPIESTTVTTPHPQLLTRISHTKVLALEFPILLIPELMLVELPSAVNCPVTKGP